MTLTYEITFSATPSLYWRATQAQKFSNWEHCDREHHEGFLFLFISLRRDLIPAIKIISDCFIFTLIVNRKHYLRNKICSIFDALHHAFSWRSVPWRKIVSSGLNEIAVPVYRLCQAWKLGLLWLVPLKHRLKVFLTIDFIENLTSAIRWVEERLQLAPTPCKPPDALYDSPSNLPPAMEGCKN